MSSRDDAFMRVLLSEAQKKNPFAIHYLEYKKNKAAAQQKAIERAAAPAPADKLVDTAPAADRRANFFGNAPARISLGDLVPDNSPDPAPIYDPIDQPPLPTDYCEADGPDYIDSGEEVSKDTGIHDDIPF
jgi:hypothetical protein